MREHVQFQTFRPRLLEVYDAPAHDYLLLRAPRVGGATYIFVKYACPPTYIHSSLARGAGSVRRHVLLSVYPRVTSIYHRTARAKSLRKNFDGKSYLDSEYRETLVPFWMQALHRILF